MTEAAWRRRFRASMATLPQWGDLRPDRLLYASNASGTWELHAWDRSADVHRQVTDRAEGTVHGRIDQSGEWIWWFNDTDGDELGTWMVEPFSGGEARPAYAPATPAYSTGLVLADELVVAGSSTDAGSRISVIRPGMAPVVIYQHAESASLSGEPREWHAISNLSSDQRLLCFHHSEHGDSRHPGLRVCDLAGQPVAELWDGPGLGLSAGGWSPTGGEPRLIVHHERNGTRRPMLWEPLRGETVDFDLDLPGELEASWYPDARALLLVHDHAGRSELLRLDIGSGMVTDLGVPRGTAGPAAVRPDGDVWYLWSDAATSYAVRGTGGGVVFRPAGDLAPSGVPYIDLWAGEVPAFLAEPAGERPHPTVVLVHGGPDWHDGDLFIEHVQAWVDHGFAVVMVNYRGSTGYGRAWRDAITGNPGFTELEDIGKVVDLALAEGIADPQRLVLAGRSWGGYITLLGLGTQPERWSLGLANVPVADYVAAYEDEMEPLKAFDRSLFGGVSPSDAPEAYRLRSPITYVEQVRVPVHILGGENDPRCPIRQIDNYVDRLRSLGKPHEMVRYDAGHSSKRVDEQIRQLELQIDFASRHLNTPSPQ